MRGRSRLQHGSIGSAQFKNTSQSAHGLRPTAAGGPNGRGQSAAPADPRFELELLSIRRAAELVPRLQHKQGLTGQTSHAMIWARRVGQVSK
eukprot:1449462-Pleurochrysis_carterae.AAC.1